MSRAIVIGYGSIGSRHARLLQELGVSVSVVSSRAIDWPRAFMTLEQALAASSADFLIIANETADHWPTLMRARQFGFGGPILVEKPLADREPLAEEIDRCLPQSVWIAYNLRFHPALLFLRERLRGDRLMSVNVSAGQDLRSWRPNRSLDSSYSLRRDRGGGVLRDLSHELDYIEWIAGPSTSVAALGGHLGPLPGDADDCWSILMRTTHCPAVSLQLDYYQRPARRQITLNLESGSAVVDLVRHLYVENGAEQQWNVQRDDTYRAQLQAFVAGERGHISSLDEGIRTMRTIAAIERAALEHAWVAS